MNLLYNHLSVNQDGHLAIGGLDTLALAKQFGTPAYIMDEDAIRAMMRTYLDAAHTYFGADALPLYASKALCFTGIYRIVNECGMGTDLVSAGELYTAVRAGFPLCKAFFHGNNKTDSDITFAMEKGVGFFVVDGAEELYAIQTEAENKGITQKILLRITPGIDPHTHKKISTGSEESKFGIPLRCGAALDMTKAALSMKNIHLCGFHCHVGSQVFNEEGNVYLEAATIMLKFFADIYHKYDVKAEILNMGGGFGVRYTEADPYLDIDANIKTLADHIRDIAEKLSIPMPKILMEPGRSIVADAGLTLYTAGTRKEIKGFKCDIDLREQEARIDKLRKEAMEEQIDNEIEVSMGEEADKYAN